MMTEDGPYVLEYNCRLGDPEAQAVLPRLKSDLLAVMKEIADGELKTTGLQWDEKACVSIVLASGGYPGFYHKGYVIEGIDSVSYHENVFVFHSGTAKNENGKFVTAGGRVLAVSVLGENLRAAHDLAYREINHIVFQDKHFRRDIGRRALEVYR
jgi:phosphoribosylamine--glycine ligase